MAVMFTNAMTLFVSRALPVFLIVCTFPLYYFRALVVFTVKVMSTFYIIGALAVFTHVFITTVSACIFILDIPFQWFPFITFNTLPFIFCHCILTS